MEPRITEARVTSGSPGGILEGNSRTYGVLSDSSRRASEESSKSTRSVEFSEAEISVYFAKNLKISKWNEFKHQFKAFFVKNSILFVRQWGSTLTKLLVPLVVLSLPLLIYSIISEKHKAMDPAALPLYSPFSLMVEQSNLLNHSTVPFYHFAVENPDKNVITRVGSMPPNKVAQSGKEISFFDYAERGPSAKYGHYVPFTQYSNSTDTLYPTLQAFEDYYFENDKKNDRNITDFKEEFRKNVTNMNFDYIPPYGAMVFYELPDKPGSTGSTKFSYRIISPHNHGGWFPLHLSAGNLTTYQFKYPQGHRYGHMMSFLHNTMINYVDPSRSTIFRPGVVMRILAEHQGFPYDEKSKFPVMDFTSAIVLGFIVLFLLPVNLSQFVRDKQARHLIMMRINGLNMLNYWIANYIFYFLEYLLVAGVFWLIGYLIKFKVVVHTSPIVIFAVIFCWGWCMISTAAFLSLFFRRVRTALFAGTLLICIGQLAGNMMYNSPYLYSSPPPWIFIYTPFSCGYVIYSLCAQCNIHHCYTAKRFFSEEISHTLYWMLGISVILTIFTIYLHEIIPQEFGIRKPIFFFTKYFRKFFRKKHKKSSISPHLDGIKVEDLKSDGIEIRSEGTYTEDLSAASSGADALIIDSVTKVYPDGKRALSDYSLTLHEGEFFGLLGPNGAGKTTLLSILSGQLEATSGRFYLYGRICDAARLHRGILGICPQFDVFYPDLTVIEHLRFYSRIRCLDEIFASRSKIFNVKGQNSCEAHINMILHETGLVLMKNQKSKLLCGGMRRRLSLAIALLGNPRIVILDEPTTGLDPCTRRELWKIFKDVNQIGKRTILMTTHAMDEADFLCNRVAIMASGKILCLGSPDELKMIYGKGYKLTIVCSPRQRPSILDSLGKHFLSKLDINYMPNYSWNDRLVLQLHFHTYDVEDFASSGSNMGDNTQNYGLGASKGTFTYNSSTDAASESQFTQTSQSTSSARDHRQHKILSKLIFYLNDLKERGIITDWGLDSPTLEDVFLHQFYHPETSTNYQKNSPQKDVKLSENIETNQPHDSSRKYEDSDESDMNQV